MPGELMPLVAAAEPAAAGPAGGALFITGCDMGTMNAFAPVPAFMAAEPGPAVAGDAPTLLEAGLPNPATPNIAPGIAVDVDSSPAQPSAHNAQDTIHVALRTMVFSRSFHANARMRMTRCERSALVFVELAPSATCEGRLEQAVTRNQSANSAHCELRVIASNPRAWGIRRDGVHQGAL